MSNNTEVAIIGAGPYGLSIAAHLHSLNVDVRVFGWTMESWINNMPKGMQLKSTGFSSTLYDPANEFRISDYCREKKIAYQDVGLPVDIETFCSYGKEFQKRYVPSVENERLISLQYGKSAFHLEFMSGLTAEANNVIIAIGLDSFRRIPKQFKNLPKEFCIHSADCNNPSDYSDKTVAVVGGGSSAIDTAILLSEAGAEVHQITRRDKLCFGDAEQENRPFTEKLIRPMSGVGAGWKNRLATDCIAPFPWLPAKIRLKIVKEFLGPSGGWFMKDRASKVPLISASEISHACIVNGAVSLEILTKKGSTKNISVNQVILGTGYEFDIHKVNFITEEIISDLELLDNTPQLDRNYQSSIKGLFFVGPISSTTFGPSMRFSLGAEFTTKRISRFFRKYYALRQHKYALNKSTVS